MWDLVAVVASTESQAVFLAGLLESRQSDGKLPAIGSMIIPACPSKCGTGGGVVNGIVCAAEILAARMKFDSLVPEVFASSSILVITSGGNIPFATALSPSPECNDGEEVLNLDVLLMSLKEIVCAPSPAGVFILDSDFVCSRTGATSGSSVAFDSDVVITASCCPVVCGDDLAVQGLVAFEEGTASKAVTDLLLSPSAARFTREGGFRALGPLLYFAPTFAFELVAACTSFPLDGCSYIGEDSDSEVVPPSPLTFPPFFFRTPIL